MQKPKKEDFKVYELASADPDYKKYNGIVYNNYMYQEALRKHKTLVKGGDLSGVSVSFNCLEQNIKGDKFKCKEHCGKCVK